MLPAFKHCKLETGKIPAELQFIEGSALMCTKQSGINAYCICLSLQHCIKMRIRQGMGVQALPHAIYSKDPFIQLTEPWLKIQVHSVLF
jgi:hypothetical protein